MTYAYCYQCENRNLKNLKPLRWKTERKILAECPHCKKLYSKWTLKQLKKVEKIDSITVKEVKSAWEK